MSKENKPTLNSYNTTKVCILFFLKNIQPVNSPISYRKNGKSIDFQTKMMASNSRISGQELIEWEKRFDVYNTNVSEFSSSK
jgi:hypothetical protein